MEKCPSRLDIIDFANGKISTISDQGKEILAHLNACKKCDNFYVKFSDKVISEP